MRRRDVLASALIGLPALGLGQTLAAEIDPKGLQQLAAPPKLSLSIAVPVHHGKRSLNEYDHFHVLLTNHSAGGINVWTDRFSWGYDNLSFEMLDEAGAVTQITKRERDWSKNYPDFLALAPGESYVLGVDFFSAQAGNIWKDAPASRKNGKPLHIKLKAIYTVVADNESEKSKVWTGRLESPQLVCTIW